MFVQVQVKKFGDRFLPMSLHGAKAPRPQLQLKLPRARLLPLFFPPPTRARMAAARTEGNGLLGDLLAAALPQGAKFTYYHISTPPTKCSPIFSAPPGARPERTYCESHFLNVSITPEDAQQQEEGRPATGEVFVYAIEVLIYTTSHLTTVFVSKADSTGYLSLLQLPRTSSSPIRAISTTFVSWLVKHRQRPASRLVVSLFARAQDQYLFPGSIENADKHVADDTALVKWWCKVLDPVLREYTPESSSKAETDAAVEQQTTAQGHLIIPGFERNDTLRFFPPSVRADPPEQRRWKHGHPLLDISRHPSAPPRCLIPHFPDDPKARYMDELDDELPDGGAATVTSPSRGTGLWRSVRSLEQFWEMMAFRQECSSGRLVGFIWMLFTPADIDAHSSSTSDVASDSGETSNTNSLAEMLAQPPTSPKRKNKPSSSRSPRQRRRSSKLTGIVIPRVPRIKSNSSTTSKPESALSPSAEQESSKYYVWPRSSRGALVLDDKDYKRATELLLYHNFAARDIAVVSTRKWVDEVAVLGRSGSRTQKWGVEIAGRKEVADVAMANGATAGQVNTLNVRKKRKGDEGAGGQQQSGGGPETNGSVNVLSAGLVRKKPKTETAPGADAGETAPADGAVNMLAGNLVRKKPKT